MPNLQSPRGTRDILPANQAAWSFVRAAATRIAEQFNFQPITTPTYEYKELFQRSIGEGTDVMDKELFLVRGVQTEPGLEEYALRPEGTAGVVRAYIEHGMHTLPQPVRLWSLVNNFRYDRPQKGRYREHVQFNIEVFGDTSPWADAWVILATWKLLQAVGLGEHVELKVNTLGTVEEREAYVDKLKELLSPRKAELSEDSQRRLSVNPLRILDSKSEGDKKVITEVPSLKESLGTESRERYEQVLQLLGTWELPFVEDALLVRGLDYYSHTAFEWVPKGSASQQSSIGGGGRYDGLVAKLGGTASGAVGAGLGLDRIVELMAEFGVDVPALPAPEYFLVAADEAGRLFIESQVLPKLLEQGKRVDTALYKEGIAAQMKAAGRCGAEKAIIVGHLEIEKGEVLVKDLGSGEQVSVGFGEI